MFPAHFSDLQILHNISLLTVFIIYDVYICELHSIDYLSPKLEIAKVRANFREAMFCDVLPEMTFLITATDTTLHRRPGETAEVLDDRHVKDITWLSQRAENYSFLNLLPSAQGRASRRRRRREAVNLWHRSRSISCHWL